MGLICGGRLLEGGVYWVFYGISVNLLEWLPLNNHLKYAHAHCLTTFYANQLIQDEFFCNIGNF